MSLSVSSAGTWTTPILLPPPSGAPRASSAPEPGTSFATLANFRRSLIRSRTYSCSGCETGSSMESFAHSVAIRWTSRPSQASVERCVKNATSATRDTGYPSRPARTARWVGSSAIQVRAIEDPDHLRGVCWPHSPSFVSAIHQHMGKTASFGRLSLGRNALP